MENFIKLSQLEPIPYQILLLYQMNICYKILIFQINLDILMKLNYFEMETVLDEIESKVLLLERKLESVPSDYFNGLVVPPLQLKQMVAQPIQQLSKMILILLLHLILNINNNNNKLKNNNKLINNNKQNNNKQNNKKSNNNNKKKKLLQMKQKYIIFKNRKIRKIQEKIRIWSTTIIIKNENVNRRLGPNLLVNYIT